MNQQLKTVPIIDRNGFRQPVKAYDISIPIDWQTSGGIFWDFANPCPNETMKTDWCAGNNEFLLQLPSVEAWQTFNVGSHNPVAGSLIMPLTTVKQYLESFVSRYRPNATILGYGDRPDLITAKLKAAQSDQNRTHAAMRAQGYEGGCNVQGGEMLIQYQEKGSVYEEIIIATAMLNFTSSPANFFGIKAETLMGHICNCLIMRAPVGKLNLKLVETIRQSVTVDSHWQAGATQIHEQKNQQALTAVQQEGHQQHQDHLNQIQAMRADHQAFHSRLNSQTQRHRSHMQAMQDAANMRSQAWQNQQASQERMHQKSVRMTRGTAMYWDPVRQQNRELSDTHRNVWQLNDLNDTRYMTDDPGFDPYRDLNMDGYQLHRQE